MSVLYQFEKLSNLDTKLRFLACQQLELALSGLFPQAEVVPFGSSVNQFGAHTTDLDMIVNFSKTSVVSIFVLYKRLSLRCRRVLLFPLFFRVIAFRPHGSSFTPKLTTVPAAAPSLGLIATKSPAWWSTFFLGARTSSVSPEPGSPFSPTNRASLGSTSTYVSTRKTTMTS